MENKMKKRVVLIATVLVLSLSLGSVAFAADNFKNLKAWFGDIKVFVNNQQVQLDAKPFIVDGTTYVPLRAVSNVFSKDIKWDGANSRIDINDRPDENAAYMTHQLIEKQLLITELESKVAGLETKVKDLESQLESKKTTSSTDLRDLENYLNKQHGTYKNVKFDISLSKAKNKDDIEVEVLVDLDKYNSRWKDLSSTNIKDYLQDIVDDILYDYKNADITGYIEDKSTSRNNELASFYITSKGSVVVNTKSGGSSSRYTLSEMESYLNREYSKYAGVNFSIDLYEEKSGISVEVYVDRAD